MLPAPGNSRAALRIGANWKLALFPFALARQHYCCTCMFIEEVWLKISP